METRVDFYFSEADVDRDLAQHAHEGTSFSPERRADGVLTEYVSEMSAVLAEFGAHATDENAAEIAADLERYRRGYLDGLHKYLAAHARLVSPMIVGPARFPTRTQEKRGATSDRRRDEWLAWREKHKEKMRRKHDPARLARAPIRAGDPDALEKLRAKVEKAEAWQALMKAANRIVRRDVPDDEKVETLVALGMKPGTARKLLVPDFMRRVGFPSYELTNNAAEVRRLKKRVAALEAEAARREEAPAAVVEVSGARIVENHELNRLQIVFPDKPPIEVRRRLRSRGFIWAPSQEAWQRRLNEAARRAAREVLDDYSERLDGSFARSAGGR